MNERPKRINPITLQDKQLPRRSTLVHRAYLNQMEVFLNSYEQYAQPLHIEYFKLIELLEIFQRKRLIEVAMERHAPQLSEAPDKIASEFKI